MTSSTSLSFNTPAFLYKTRSILENPQYNHIITWDQQGIIIKIIRQDLMEKTLLPKQFRHGKYNSFVRQLNMYGFKKLKKRLHGIAFSHPNFKRDTQDVQNLIKRRKGILKNNQNNIRSQQVTKLSNKQELITKQSVSIDDIKETPFQKISQQFKSSINSQFYYPLNYTLQPNNFSPYPIQWMLPYFNMFH